MTSSALIGLSRHRIGVDGTGVTTLVAFHSCPLNCKYCLNPQALSPEGVWKRFSPEELFRAVDKDDLYFRATGGGVTFGGGEPLVSYKDILQFYNLCKKNGKKWKINIETSLNVSKIFVEAVENAVDHWIVDIKDMNPVIYRAYTGKNNELVKTNLQYLIKNNAKVTVRVPLIPRFNNEQDVEKSVLSLQEMGIRDIERFTYIIKEH
ncbi:MAG: radical SAM protein [Bacteroidaceae bacterium]|nr:radical SAM protein [Bacteroidaceae bacterium]